MSGHFINKCECGAILAQCRCPSTDKPTFVVQSQCPACEPRKAEMPREAYIRHVLVHEGAGSFMDWRVSVGPYAKASGGHLYRLVDPADQERRRALRDALRDANRDGYVDWNALRHAISHVDVYLSEGSEGGGA